MKNWLRKISFWLALVAGVAFAAEAGWLEIERRREGRLTREWRRQFRLYEELAKASPVRTAQNEQAMANEVSRLQQEVAGLRAKLFPEVSHPDGNVRPEERIETYFDVAALVGRLRAAAIEAEVIVKPDDYFGFAAYAHEAPPAADLSRVKEQCFVGEELLTCLFSGRPRELLAFKREPVGTGATGGDRQQADYFALERGLSLRVGEDLETMAFRVEFTGETSALRGFLEALAHATELLVVRGIDAMPGGGGIAEKTGNKAASNGPVARPSLSRFTVTIERVRPAKTSIAHAP